MNHKP